MIFNRIYNQVLEYTNQFVNTPYYLAILLVIFTRQVSKINFDQVYEKNKNLLFKVISSCDQEFQTIFYTFLLTAYDSKNESIKLKEIQKKCSSLTYTDDNLRAIYCYHTSSYYVKTFQFNLAIEYYNMSKDLFEKSNNLKKISNLKILFSQYLQTVGLVEEAIQNDLETLEYLINHQYLLTNVRILYNNIARGYFLLKKFDLSKEYYLKAINYLMDNETYFCLAYCYFQLNDIDHTLLTIQSGKNSKNTFTYYYYLLEWLEVFITKTYSKKATKILLKILNKFDNDLDSFSRDFIYSQLVNYYQSCKDFQKAFYYSRLLLKSKCVGTVAFLDFSDNIHK